MNLIKKYISTFNEYKSKKETEYFGTSLYDKLQLNPIPGIAIAILALSFLYLSIDYMHFLGDFFYWFVAILEIPKVLKISFLEEVKNFHYLSLFVYSYIAVSLLIDLSELFQKLSIKTVFVKSELWQIQSKLFGKELSKIDLKNLNLTVHHKHGLIYDIFGLNQIIWKKDHKIYAKTPYFFPFGNNKKIINQLLRR